MIARTEATYANAKGSIEGYKQSGIANAKKWINSGDRNVRDEHGNGIGVKKIKIKNFITTSPLDLLKRRGIV